MKIRPIMAPLSEHLRSLQLTPGRSKRGLPRLAPRAKVLDVGCGAGQSLRTAPSQHTAFGLDPDLRALRLGARRFPGVHFVCGLGESLPFREGSFDAVTASVSLPYMDIRLALNEFRRVLKKNGVLWTLLHTISIPWRQARSARRPKAWVYFAYIVANTACFHLTGRQFRIRGSCESFQTTWAFRRALRRHRFEEVSVFHRRRFVVQARAC